MFFKEDGDEVIYGEGLVESGKTIVGKRNESAGRSGGDANGTSGSKGYNHDLDIASIEETLKLPL